ncbi:MAG: type II secretion system ATPase GspE [Methylococcales bacterium]|nr:type II secretion system ATPase GspE [Methylococcales bacterium]
MEETEIAVLLHDSASNLVVTGWQQKLVKKIQQLFSKQPPKPLESLSAEAKTVQFKQEKIGFKSVPINQKIGELLRDIVNLSQADLDQSLSLQSDEKIGQVLLVQDYITEKDLAQALALQQGLTIAKPSQYPVDPVMEEDISKKFLTENNVIPLAVNGEVLTIASLSPEDSFIRDSLVMLTGMNVVVKVGVTSEFSAAHERLYGAGQSMMDQIVDDFDGDAEDDVEHLMDMASEAPIIRLVSLITQKAVEARASDIHIEPFENELKVRYRIDGVLQDVESPPSYSTAAVISRIKIMAKLNIAERRLPQDGRVKLRVDGKEVDLRVSTVPTMYGESVVMRILLNDSVLMDFDTLGFDGEPREQFIKVLMQPNGILLVTGPTGSGKTTTLYTALNKLNVPGRKIITVEDPVEYQLEGVNQIQVKSSIGLTFSNALRSIVRQDPDIIMIGEMRDAETAQIAVQSALTGHMVLSTLHTNDAPSSLTRLMDMGVEDYLVTSSVNGVLAQRLVRRLCPHCREKVVAPPEVVTELKLSQYTDDEQVRIYKPKGCERCGKSGYKGRSVVVQMMTMTDTIRRMVMKHEDATAINHAALKEGMATLLDDGLRKCLQGVTTIEEVMRVTHDVSQ